MNTLNQEELEDLVIAEATKLKQHATKKELDKLDFNTLNSNDNYLCIYGQMTNDCRSERASTLLKKSCERVFKCDDEHNSPRRNPELNGLIKDIKEKRNTKLFSSDNYLFWSPIEVFIAQDNKENNKKLIDFLKGETNKLEF